jgi:hypothetical protein
MAHRYGQPVAVTRAVDGTPAHFRWKGSEWPVSKVVLDVTYDLREGTAAGLRGAGVHATPKR